MYGKIASVSLELGGEVNSNVTGTPLYRRMCGVIGNAEEAVRGWEKVAARSEGFAFVAILYTGVVGNKCGLSKVLRRALFVGIMNSFDKGCNPLVWCSTLCRVNYALRTIGAWGGDNGYAGNKYVWGVLAHRSIALLLRSD